MKFKNKHFKKLNLNKKTITIILGVICLVGIVTTPFILTNASKKTEPKTTIKKHPTTHKKTKKNTTKKKKVASSSSSSSTSSVSSSQSSTVTSSSVSSSSVKAPTTTTTSASSSTAKFSTSVIQSSSSASSVAPASSSSTQSQTTSTSNTTSATTSSQTTTPAVTSGFNILGYHSEIGSFSGTGYVPHDKVYAWTGLANWYLIDILSQAHAYVAKASVGTAVTINGRTYHITNIYYNQPNNSTTEAFVESQLQSHAVGFQTCSANVKGSTLTLYFAN